MSALAAGILIDRFGVDLVINTGILVDFLSR